MQFSSHKNFISAKSVIYLQEHVTKHILLTCDVILVA